MEDIGTSSAVGQYQDIADLWGEVSVICERNVCKDEEVKYIFLKLNEV